MATPDPERCAQARRLYVDGSDTIAAIAGRLGIAESTLRGWAKRYDWPRRGQRGPSATAGLSSPAPPVQATDLNADGDIDVRQLARRIYRAIDHNLSIMESRMKDEGASGAGEPERDLRALGDVLRSAEKLKDLEPGNANPTSTATRAGRAPLTAEEEDALGQHLVERILKLRERRGLPGSDR